MRIIDLEAHYYTQEYLNYLASRKELPRFEVNPDGSVKQHLAKGVWGPRSKKLMEKLCDLGEDRIREMDEAGVDLQVLSFTLPGCEQFDNETGQLWSKKLNNHLAEWVNKYPERYIGLAALAPQNADQAAAELERCVKQLGFRGAKLNSHCCSEYLDDPKFWALFAKAEELDVPIYLHPTVPSDKMIDAFQPYGFPIAGPPLGFGIDCLLHSVRLIYSGLFDKFPKLKIILGHLGEGLPFWMFRIDFYWNKPWAAPELKPKTLRKPSDYIRDNFVFTSSGMHYVPSFINAYMAVGGDNLCFGADHPFESVQESIEGLGILPICEQDKEKFYHGNAERLFKIPPKK